MSNNKYAGADEERKPDRMLRQFDVVELKPLDHDCISEIRAKFRDAAEYIVAAIPPGPERTVALRKLLEGKDAAVRAWLFAEPERAR